MPASRAPITDANVRVSALTRLAGPLAVASSGLAMLGWTWLKWPDVLVDFGQQLYLPWQITEGAVLYRDLAYFHGPLAPYFTALLFELFGTSLMTLVAANLLVVAAIAVLIYRLLLAVGDHLSAAVAGVVFMTLFGFGQYLTVGNFNYVTPYEHSMTYGLLLALAALSLLGRFMHRGGLGALAGSGLFLGLAFLTKAEVWLAAAAAIGMGLGLAVVLHAPPGPRRPVVALAVFCGAALAPLAVSVALLATAMPLHDAIIGTLGSWPAIVDGRTADLRFYREGLGTLHAGTNAGILLLMTAFEAALIGAAVAGSVAFRRWPAVGAAAASAALGVLFWLILKAIPTAVWMWRPLPVVMIAAGIAVAWQLGARRHRPQEARRLILALALIAFALGMLLKMILNARVPQYGFVLAMPAALVTVVLLLSWIPSWIRRFGGEPWVVRGAGLALVLVTIAVHLPLIGAQLAVKTCAVGAGADRMLVDPVRCRLVNQALDEIERVVGPGQTFAALPEGVILNYLARRVNPTPHNNFMPPGVAVFGEEDMLRRLQANPPDVLALVHKDTSDFGFPLFGRDYGQPIVRWIDEHYEEISLIGERPLQERRRYGILLLRRRGDAGS